MKLLTYIGKGLLVIGVVIFILGFKLINYNLYFLIIGGVMAGIGLYILQFFIKKEETQAFNEFDEWRKDLMINGT